MYINVPLVYISLSACSLKNIFFIMAAYISFDNL